MKHNKLLILFGALCLSYSSALAQCTEAKDSEMAKYKQLTMTQDAQGCSQCAMLALYFCSAKYCVQMEDKRKVGALISECKQNIQKMGQPYCCPEYLNKTPEWGSMAGSTATSKASSAPSGGGLMSNPLGGSSSGGGTSTTGTNEDLTGKLLETIVKLDNGKSSDLTSFAQGYAQGQQLTDTANSLIDLFSASPEEKARKEALRVEAEKKAAEDAQRQQELRIENENNAKKEFNEYLAKRNKTNKADQSFLVIQLMDKYIADKYYYDASPLLPEWSNWMKESVANNDKFVTTVFAGKALGFNLNKFNYSLGLTIEEAIKLLEKVSDSENEYAPYLGINFDFAKKSIQEKNKKKKVIKREITTFPIKNVVKETAAETADLKVGDVILKYNDAHVSNLFDEIKKSKIGDKIKLTLLRDNKEITKEITIGKRIKDSYKVDAMLLLANYYNTKASGNPEKALYYFTKAAENGSPNAMFALGEIYKDNVFGNKKLNVKYKFKKNEEFALEWYLKSIQNTEYNNSLIFNIYKTGSYFEPAVFDELITMYQKGIGCEKSTEKANQIAMLKNSYLEKNK
jgi:TPR repeat protein